MTYDPRIHHRRSIRLPEYDYARSGAYFVTVCVQGKACLYGDVVDGEMRLNDAGRMVQSVWNEIPACYLGVDIDASVVMPNHFHGIIVLVGAGPRACPISESLHGAEMPVLKEGQARGPAPTETLSLADVVHRFKTMTTKRYADGVKQNGWARFQGKLWQRNYWEHIARDEPEFDRIREYIANNPIRWEMDRLHPGWALRETPAPYGNDGCRVDNEDWMV